MACRIPIVGLGASVSSSSEYSAEYRAEYGRLHYMTRPGGSGASSWSAAINDNSQYLQVFLAMPRTVYAIATQGRADGGQWVTEYMVKYTLDGEAWFAADGGRLFGGNFDESTVVVHDIATPIRALAVRICPTKWHTHISMRCEVYVD
eukprot:TRINITY_DN5313_c0_g1_i4.p1 TRINITY_DN5313_c0_g1~~TRINITY_DN5313_c0_g1_i4.p1  ORF type:complete len:148 (-),score=21.41 TRINITY_DN5313_c0_g1_i4:107-550(-)